MLLATVNPEAAAAIGNIKKIGVGNRVVYHTRAGMMRQGRTSFPADVLRQHPDDGSLDLYVIMEPEEIIMEQRVQFRSHNQAHHCWSAVENVPGAAPSPGIVSRAPGGDDVEELHEHVAHLTESVGVLAARLEPLLKRVTVLEMKRPPGRPPNQPKTEPTAD